MIEHYYSMSVEQKAQKFSLVLPGYWVVPFLKYALWKHNVAKAANLWVKLQQTCNLTHKIATPGSISLPLFTRE